MDNLIRDIKTLFGSSNSTEDELPEKPPPTVKMEPKPNRKICLRRGDHPKDWEPLTFANLLYKAESPKEADNTKKYLDYVLSPLDYDKLEFENSKEADELRQTNPVDPKIVAAAQKIVAAEKSEVPKETKKIDSKAENNTMENTATSQASKNASADETSEKQKKPPKESIEMKLPLTPVKDPYLIQILKRKIPHDSSLRVVPSQPSNPNEDASQWNTRVCGYSKRNPIDEQMEITNENNSKLLETDVNLAEKKEEPQEPTSETFEASSLQNYLEARGLLPNILNTPIVREDLPSSKDDVQVQSSATPSTSKDDRPSKDEEENNEQPLEMSKILPSIMKEKLKQSAEETSRYILENYTVPWNKEKVENEEPNPEPPKRAPPKQEPPSDLPPSKKVVRKRQPRDGTPQEQVHPRRFKISKEPVKVDLSERLWEHPRDVHNKPSSDPIKEPIKEPPKELIKTIYSKPVIEEYLVYKTTDVQIPRSTDVKSDAGNLFSRGEAAKYVAESSKDESPCENQFKNYSMKY